ncbi:hypothetical protein ACIOWM_16520 [Streptomyces anulatus]
MPQDGEREDRERGAVLAPGGDSWAAVDEHRSPLCGCAGGQVRVGCDRGGAEGDDAGRGVDGQFHLGVENPQRPLRSRADR